MYRENSLIKGLNLDKINPNYMRNIYMENTHIQGKEYLNNMEPKLCLSQR